MTKDDRVSLKNQNQMALVSALKITAGNIRSLGPAGALSAVPTPYREWLALVEDAIAKAERRPKTA